MQGRASVLPHPRAPPRQCKRRNERYAHKTKLKLNVKASTMKIITYFLHRKPKAKAQSLGGRGQCHTPSPPGPTTTMKKTTNIYILKLLLNQVFKHL